MRQIYLDLWNQTQPFPLNGRFISLSNLSSVQKSTLNWNSLILPGVFLSIESIGTFISPTEIRYSITIPSPVTSRRVFNAIGLQNSTGGLYSYQLYSNTEGYWIQEPNEILTINFQINLSSIPLLNSFSIRPIKSPLVDSVETLNPLVFKEPQLSIGGLTFSSDQILLKRRVRGNIATSSIIPDGTLVTGLLYGNSTSNRITKILNQRRPFQTLKAYNPAGTEIPISEGILRPIPELISPIATTDNSGIPSILSIQIGNNGMGYRFSLYNLAGLSNNGLELAWDPLVLQPSESPPNTYISLDGSFTAPTTWNTLTPSALGVTNSRQALTSIGNQLLRLDYDSNTEVLIDTIDSSLTPSCCRKGTSILFVAKRLNVNTISVWELKVDGTVTLIDNFSSSNTPIRISIASWNIWTGRYCVCDGSTLWGVTMNGGIKVSRVLAEESFVQSGQYSPYLISVDGNNTPTGYARISLVTQMDQKSPLLEDSYGWSGTNWIKGHIGYKAFHVSSEPLVEGINLRWGNINEAIPDGSWFTQAIHDGVLYQNGDNRSSIDISYSWSVRDRMTSDFSGTVAQEMNLSQLGNWTQFHSCDFEDPLEHRVYLSGGVDPIPLTVVVGQFNLGGTTIPQGTVILEAYTSKLYWNIQDIGKPVEGYVTWYRRFSSEPSLVTW